MSVSTIAVAVVGSTRGALALGLGALLGSAPASTTKDPFRQLEEVLPTPTSTRAASGAPGHRYWQQRADYDIAVEIVDDPKQPRLVGSETIVYHNQSPDELQYVWVQLDANIYAPDSRAALTSAAPTFDRVPYGALRSSIARTRFDGSVHIAAVREGKLPLEHTVVDTMMRIDLPKPLKPGRKQKIEIEWSYDINDSELVGGRTGFETFPDDHDNRIFEMAQWFPRMAAYHDVWGWQHDQYLGRGEFTLEFGDYDVAITVPEDFVVGATGELRNAKKVLSKTQQRRLEQARSSTRDPVFIVNPKEAADNAKDGATGKKTWVYRAKDVRDFAFAASRKFIWDARGVDVGKRKVMAMSLYPVEAEPLWSQYSTHAIIHTLEVYSRYTVDYPYPVAYSVNGPVGGMEYPMICFNGPRPEEDGTYSKRTKYALISVVIHEVGHNFFPMIVNSDERQWTWMDEGLNTFLQYLAEQEWEKDYPSRRGDPRDITGYMLSEGQVPVMTHSDSLLQFGNNAYAKPATALVILRETVMGRELFDFAFREYARRWQFKRPMPADFFRTMEDASGLDLDWFWRGWFYTTDHVDIALTGVNEFTVSTLDPDIEKPRQKSERDSAPTSVHELKDSDAKTRVERYEDLEDFYNDWDPLEVTEADRKRFKKLVETLEPHERELLNTKTRFYVLEFDNRGGLAMPILLDLELADGKHRSLRIPADIWRRSPDHVSKLVTSEEEIVRIAVDPNLETADVDVSNNHWPPKKVKSRFELFKPDESHKNPMQESKAESSASKPADEAGAR